MLIFQTLKRIRTFGLNRYVAKKLYRRAPGMSRRLIGSQNAKFVPTAYGVSMVPNWDDATFRMCVFGGHGRVLADLLEGLTDPFVFLDVGSNQGLFSMIAASNPACREAIAFEPVAATFELLEANVGRHADGAKIRCIKAAVSETSGTSHISIKAGHSGNASMIDSRTQSGETMEIRTVAADEVAAMLPPDAALVIKVDVEGFEGVVVPELMKLGASHAISHVFCEVDLDATDFAPISDALSAVGLTAQSRHGGRRHFDLLAVKP